MCDLNVLSVNAPNVSTLAIFICHLFLGGSFQIVHILYDSKVIDANLTIQIELMCPDRIQWEKSDITQLSLSSHNIERTDHILRLIFFDPKHLKDEITRFKEHFAFYRIFVFASTDKEEQTYTIRNSSELSKSSTLVLRYDKNDETTSIHRIPFDDRVIERVSGTDMSHVSNAISFQNQNNGFRMDDNYFSKTFGENERERLLIIRRMGYIERTGNPPKNDAEALEAILVNYYFLSLKAAYIERTWFKCLEPNAPPTHQLLVLDRSKVYKELSVYFNERDNSEKFHSKLIENHTYNLHLNAFLLTSENKKRNMTKCLYPHQTMGLNVVFIYGDDMRRLENILSINESIRIISAVIVAFMILATFSVCIARKVLRLSRSDISSSFIEILAVFLDGGDLHIRHKFERWFFGILLFGAFFIVLVFAGDLLECFIRISDQIINTFEQLTEYNVPIVISAALSAHSAEIHDMFRRKVGPNINYIGEPTSENVRLEDAHIAVIGDDELEMYCYAFKHLLHIPWDFDIFSEKLGAVRTQYCLESDDYISNRVMKKVNKATSSAMESGSHQFYTSFVDFKYKVRRSSDQKVDDIHALTTEQLMRPIYLILFLWGSAVFLFMVEFIVHKWQHWDIHSG